MSEHLIYSDITLMRKRYDEALEMQGIPVKYQFPNIAESNAHGESVIDSYSDEVDTHVFFDGNPKVKTIKRYGWVVENSQDLPFLVHCSFNLPHVQKDCIFKISGEYSELPDRIFKVTDIAYDLQAPDHLVCKIVPVYDNNIVGRTKKEDEKIYSTSNRFLKPNTDYRGHPYVTKEDAE